MHYENLRRHPKPRMIRKNFANTQKQLLITMSLLIIFVFGDHGLFQLYKLKKERKSVQNHISELRKEREKLQSNKNRLETDLDYIEKLARERFRMAKPGEKVFKIIPEK